MDQLIAEVIAAYREHEVMLMVGGHKPDRVRSAIDALEVELKKSLAPTKDRKRNTL